VSDVRIVGLAAGLLVLVLMVSLLRRRQLKEKYAVLWLVASVPIGVLAVFPGSLDAVAGVLGVADPVNLLLFLAVLVLLGVCVHLSWETSRLEDETRTLAEEVALLRLQVERLPPPHGPGQE
jgi:hypothetical protein